MLALPAGWVILAVGVTDSVAAATTTPVLGGLAPVIALASTPYMIYLLATTLVPSLRRVRDRRLVLGLIGITVTVALAGWLAGSFNDRLLTCHDFEVAGEYQPENCAR